MRHLTSPLALGLAAAALTLGGAGALTAGCGTTGQEHVTFAARAAGFAHGAGPVQFTTSTGWAVTLSEARVAVGPLYLNTLEPLACDGCESRSLIDRLSDALVPRAWAHGEDHLGAGRIAGQVTEQVEVDALSPTPVVMPRGGDGVDLPVRSAEVWLFNRDGAMRGAAIRVAGVAERTVDGRALRVPFRGALVADASITNAQTPLDLARRVRGIPVDLTLAEGGVLTVRVDPRQWFTGADFSELLEAAGADDEERVFSPMDNVGRAFLNAARSSRGVYTFEFGMTR
jgi:hypothetical protein